MTAHKNSLIHRALLAMDKAGPVDRKGALHALSGVCSTKQQITVSLYNLQRLGLVEGQLKVSAKGAKRIMALK